MRLAEISSDGEDAFESGRANVSNERGQKKVAFSERCLIIFSAKKLQAA